MEVALQPPTIQRRLTEKLVGVIEPQLGHLARQRHRVLHDGHRESELLRNLPFLQLCAQPDNFFAPPNVLGLVKQVDRQCPRQQSVRTDVNVADGKQVLAFAGSTDVVTRLAVSHDNTFLIAASQDKNLRQWTLATAAALGTPILNAAPIRDLGLSADSKRAVITGDDGAEPDNSRVGYFPSILAMMKITTAPNKPPPASSHTSE